MNKLILALFTVLLAINAKTQQTYNTININGVDREYYQYLPTGYDPLTESLPVVFTLHGIGGTALSTSSYGLNQLANTERFIPVYLQGKLNSFSQTSWNNGTLLESDAEDLAFISNLLDSLNSNLNINMARIYMTGISMGSIMTYNVCRYMSDRIAAVVCHIGTMSTEDLAAFNPLYPVPTLHMHGTADATVPYDSGALPSLSLVPQTLTELKATNGWAGDSTVTTIADNVSDGITVDRIIYNCTTPLEHWRMNNADHILLFEPVNDTGSVDVTWGFLKQFTHPNPSTASLPESPTYKPSIYPNPTKDNFNLINYGDFTAYSIYGIDGKLIQGNLIPMNTNTIDFLEIGTYIFEFRAIDGSISSQVIIIK